MKKTALIIILTVATGCSTVFTSPVSGIEYRGEISARKGLCICAKPPFWDVISGIGSWILTESDKEDKTDAKHPDL